MNCKELNEKLETIEGWFDKIDQITFDFLLSFLDNENRHGYICEIGVYYGKSLAKLSQYIHENEHLFAFDFEFNRENQKTSILNGIKKMSSMSLKQLHLVEGDSSHLNPYKEIDGFDLYKKCKFVHLDGAHNGKIVYDNLKYADHILSDDGILVLDDWHFTIYPDIQKAFYKYTMAHPGSFEIFLSTEAKAYACRPSNHNYYLYKAHDIKNILKENDMPETVYETINTLDTRSLILFDDKKKEFTEESNEFIII